MAPQKKMPYGETYVHSLTSVSHTETILRFTVRLGTSGLKVSKIILGCMSYGTPEWQAWVLSEEEGIKHIKAASVLASFQAYHTRLTTAC